MEKEQLRLYLVTDSCLAGTRDLEWIVSQAVEGGVTMVQLREKDIDTGKFIERAIRLKKALEGTGVPLIINDRVDVALSCDADGVHIGQSDMPYETARRLLGPDKIIGLSIENFEQLDESNRLDVDYVAASPVFATPTKTDTASPWGLDGLREFVKRSVHPCVAIGGMNASTAAGVMATGADGIAVVSAIISDESPLDAALQLRNIVDYVSGHKRIQDFRASRFIQSQPSAATAAHTAAAGHGPECVCAPKHYPTVLTIAGSDSGGGAGIQADIKAISATGSYAASAITAVTVQNTLGVEAVHPVPVEILSAQIASVLSDIGADAVKIGMLHSAEVVRAVRESLDRFNVRDIVLDPVMVSTSGHKLIEDEAIEVLSKVLILRARVITPNVPEAEILSGVKITSQSQLPDVAKRLSCGGRVSVLMKAGHLTEECLTDIFYNAEEDHVIELTSGRLYTRNTHGTGCTLSSAFASFLAHGLSLDDAARAAKDYVTAAIASGSRYEIGHGHGPVDHFFAMKKL